MSMEKSHSLMRLSRIKLLFKSTDPEFPLLLSETIILPAMATYSLLQTGEKIKACMFLTKKLPVHVRYCDVWQNWPVFSWWGKPHYWGHRLQLFLENWLSWTFHPFYGLSVMLHCSHHFFKPLKVQSITLLWSLILICVMRAAFWISYSLMIYSTKLMGLHSLYHPLLSGKY